MPRLLPNNISPLQTTLINALYTLTLSACEQSENLKCRNFDIFISSKNLRDYMGVTRSSSYQNKVLADMVGTWVKRVKRFEGYPNGMYFYALTEEAFKHLDKHNRAVGFLILEPDQNRVLTINGTTSLFDMTGEG